jgi:hypothetical protein
MPDTIFFSKRKSNILGHSVLQEQPQPQRHQKKIDPYSQTLYLFGFDFDGEYFFVRGGEYSEIHKIQKYSKK